jgi:hypothetical protein
MGIADAAAGFFPDPLLRDPSRQGPGRTVRSIGLPGSLTEKGQCPLKILSYEARNLIKSSKARCADLDCLVFPCHVDAPPTAAA